MPGGIHTWTAGEVVTASNMNVFLMNQAVAQVTSGSRPNSPQTGQHIYQTDNDLDLVYDSAGHWVQTTPSSAWVQTIETTTSTTFTDLATVGPSVSVTTGTKALVALSVNTWNTNGVYGTYTSYAVSGATTISAATNNTNGQAVVFIGQAAPQAGRTPGFFMSMLTGLTPGVNTFKMQYAAITSGTAEFALRAITVWGIP